MNKEYVTSNFNLNIAILILFYEKVEQTIECIESFLSSSLNIYILNNNSSLSAKEKLSVFCKPYNQIKIFDSDINLGVGVGRNYLITHTEEEWLLFVDNDIIMKTGDWHQKITQHITRDKWIEVFIPKLFNIHESTYVTYCELVLKDNHAYHQKTDNNIINSFPGGASIVNRKVFDRLGLYDEQMFIGLEDFEFSLRSIIHNNPIKAELIHDIELIHDHKQVKKIEDKKAVLTRYDKTKIEDSFRRINKKYKGISFEHEWRPWVITQIDNLLVKENIDLTTPTPVKNYGSITENKIIPDLYLKDNVTGKQLYIDIMAIAEKMQEVEIISFGYKSDEELTAQVHNKDIKITQINFLNENIKTNFSGKNCFSCDLTDYTELDELFSKLKTNKNLLILLNDIIQYITDPRPLLRTLKKLLLLNQKNKAIISTSDRTKKYNTNFSYLENNENDIHKCPLDELKLFLISSGFIIEEAKYIPSGNQFLHTFVTIRLTKEEYDIFLQTQYLPASDMEYLIFTNEYGKSKITGGIGSYIEEMENIFPEEKLGICLLGKGDLLPEEYIIKIEKLILPDTFFTPDYLEKLPLSEIAWQTLEQIIYYYPRLTLVEYGDYEGYGSRIAQAKRAGLLPASILTKVCCHGSKTQIEKVHNIWSDLWLHNLMYEEKISIELADIINFPTEYIYKLYLMSGHDIDINKLKMLRLPFTYRTNLNNIHYRAIDTLIFFGKRHFFKGYAHFTEALKILLSKDLLTSIKQIILLGPKFDCMEIENSFFDSINKEINIIELYQKRKDAIETISKYADRALCIMPYLNDNHPYSLLETISTGCQVLTVKAGGIQELLPEELHNFVLCNPDAQGITDGIKNTLTIPVDKRTNIMSSLFNTMYEEQIKINHENKNIVSNILSHNKANIEKESGNATVLVKCQNTDLRYIEDLVYGLTQQIKKPEKIIFIDNGSDDKYIKELKLLLSDKLKIPFDIVSNSMSSNKSNKITFELIKTDYIIKIDPWNIPRIDFIKKYMNFLNKNQEFSAVTCYYETFNDKDNWQEIKNILNVFRPTGDFSMLLGQIDNLFGHSNSAYRTDLFKEIGGLDELYNSSCNDWPLFLKIKSHNKKIGVIPKSTLLYRICSETGKNIDNNYSLQRQLAENTFSLSKFDSFRLQGIIRHYQRLEQENINLKSQINNLSSALRYNYYAQLFIDTGSGFNERESIINNISVNDRLIEFNLSEYTCIKNIRFDPLNNFVLVKLNKIEIVNHNKEIFNKLTYKSNALSEKDNFFIFDTDDPQIYIDINEKYKIDKIIIKLEYISLGSEVYTYILSEKNHKILKELLERNITLQELEYNHIISQKDLIIREVTEKEARYDDFLNSYRWKFIVKCDILLNKIFPYGSRRRNILKYITRPFLSSE